MESHYYLQRQNSEVTCLWLFMKSKRYIILGQVTKGEKCSFIWGVVTHHHSLTPLELRTSTAQRFLLRSVERPCPYPQRAHY